MYSYRIRIIIAETIIRFLLFVIQKADWHRFIA